MAFREVRVLEVKEVLRLSREGVAKKRIARQLGLDVKTVRRYLEPAEAAAVGLAGDLDAAVAAVVGRGPVRDRVWGSFRRAPLASCRDGWRGHAGTGGVASAVR